jgi:hypothetical protein
MCLSDFVPDRVARSSTVSPLEVKLGATPWAENERSRAHDVFLMFLGKKRYLS